MGVGREAPDGVQHQTLVVGQYLQDDAICGGDRCGQAFQNLRKLALGQNRQGREKDGGPAEFAQPVARVAGQQPDDWGRDIRRGVQRRRDRRVDKKETVRSIDAVPHPEYTKIWIFTSAPLAALSMHCAFGQGFRSIQALF